MHSPRWGAAYCTQRPIFVLTDHDDVGRQIAGLCRGSYVAVVRARARVRVCVRVCVSVCVCVCVCV